MVVSVFVSVLAMISDVLLLVFFNWQVEMYSTQGGIFKQPVLPVSLVCQPGMGWQISSLRTSMTKTILPILSVIFSAAILPAILSNRNKK